MTDKKKLCPTNNSHLNVAAQEALYRGLFDNISSGVAVYQAVDNGQDFIIVDFNKAAEKIEQISRSKILGRKVTACFPGIKEMNLLSVFRRVYQTDIPESHPETRYYDGRIESWRKNYVYKLPTGEIVAVYDDVTEQVESRKYLAESENFLRRVIDSIPSYVFVKDYQGNFVLVNETTAKLYGKPANEMVGTNERQYHLTADFDRRNEQFLAEDRYVIDHQQILYLPEMEIPLLDGSSSWIQTVKVPISHRNDPRCVLVVSTDITQIKYAEAALKNSEEKYRLLVENANEAILVAQQGKIVFHNKKMEEIIGFTAEEIEKMVFVDFIHPEDRSLVFDRYRPRLAGENVPSLYDLRVVSKVGDLKWVNINAVCIIWNGNPATLNFLSEITERKRLEAQFIQAQKMEAVGKLAGGFAHDFNNILTVIEGNANLALMSLNPQDPAYQDLEQVDKAVKKAAKLTSQLLAFSRKQTLQPIVVNLSAIVQEIKKMLLRVIGEDIELEISSDANLWNIRVDPVQMEQAILNIAINARDAMPTGGKLTLHTSNQDIKEEAGDKHAFIKPGQYVCLTITDTGEGMSDEVKHQIFEPFFTTKKSGEGTGLGLSMVFGFVKQSGGYITVDSQLGKGTTFQLYSPRTLQPPNSTQKSLQETDFSPGSESIMVVEDNNEVRYLAVRILQKAGYKVSEARSALDALALFQAGQYCDLIIADVVMPLMKGTTLFKLVKERFNSQIKALFISGYSVEHLFKQEGFDENTPLLTKPFDPLVLLKKVRTILDES